MPPESWTTYRARIAGYKRRGRTEDDPELRKARRDLAVARLADHVRTVVTTGPPLTAAQRAQIDVLLCTDDEGVS